MQILPVCSIQKLIKYYVQIVDNFFLSIQKAELQFLSAEIEIQCNWSVTV